MATPEAGWYADPQAAGQLRWWDGQAWTAHTSAAPQEEGAVASATEFTPGPRPEDSGPTFLQAPVAGADQSAAVAAPAFTPLPAATPPAARRGLSTGAVVGIVAGAVALVSVLGLGGWWLVAGSPLSELASGTEQGSGDDVDLADPPDSAPLDYQVPVGFVEVADTATGVHLAFPAEFIDYTSTYAEIIDVDSLDSAVEDLTLIAAFMSGTSLANTPDEFVVLHTAAPSNIPATVFHANSMRGLEIAAGDIEWDESVVRETPFGLEVTMSVGRPLEVPIAQYSLATAVRGDVAITFNCVDYGEGNQCFRMDEIVDTIWIEP